MRFSIIYFSILLLTIVSCQKKSVSMKGNAQEVQVGIVKTSGDSIKKVKKDKIFPNPGKLTAFLNENVQDSVSSCLLIIQKERIFIDSLTLNVYRANNLNGFWSDSTSCRQIIKVLNDSRFDGLNPKDYETQKLDGLFKDCFMSKKQTNDSLYWKLELTLTKNYLRYLNHLRYGKINPGTIIQDWDYKRVPELEFTAAEYSKFLVENPDVAVMEFRPQLKMYNTLRSVLFSIDSIEKNDSFEWDPIKYIGRDLQVGDTSWLISKIKSRLLPVAHVQEDVALDVFDEDLLAAINYFQQHEGMTPNGKIDKATINKLNFTLQQTEDVVRVNMERCRWLLIRGELPDFYIVVNVADYSLRVYKNQKQVYRTKVVVGSSSKETPLFHSKMTTIEFNPYWTVPLSISTDEILPKLKTDTSYLRRNNMELLKDNSPVYITDYSPYSKNNFPFVIRQKPGVNNSLGVVKFLFPNPYSVYFHDTPSKSLFEKDSRAFSHGCVRVQKPLDLAAYLLADQGVTRKEINDIIREGKNTPIALQTKIPVILTYWTCFTDENNQVYFFKDIYGRDKLILKALNN